MTLTYLGVAGWDIAAGSAEIVTDPYFSRPDLAQPVVSDDAAVAAHTPVHVDAVLVGHSHVDHVLDAPAVVKRTGAQLIGSESTAHLARASGVEADHIIPVRGGEDYEFGTFSIRVIASLHSALDGKHVEQARAIPADVVLPMKMADYGDGGTFAYLVRVAGFQILVLDTANFIERELEGIHPDIAIVAPGLREEVHDYTCRLMRVLGYPPVVYATHFDNWRGPPVDEPPDDDLIAFGRELARCSPRTRLVIPKHFQPNVER